MGTPRAVVVVGVVVVGCWHTIASDISSAFVGRGVEERAFAGFLDIQLGARVSDRAYNANADRDCDGFLDAKRACGEGAEEFVVWAHKEERDAVAVDNELRACGHGLEDGGNVLRGVQVELARDIEEDLLSLLVGAKLLVHKRVLQLRPNDTPHKGNEELVLHSERAVLLIDCLNDGHSMLCLALPTQYGKGEQRACLEPCALVNRPVETWVVVRIHNVGDLLRHGGVPSNARRAAHAYLLPPVHRVVRPERVVH